MTDTVTASNGFLPPSAFLEGLPQFPPMPTSGPLLPPLFPIPPPLESTPLMPQLASFLPPNFPSQFSPPTSTAEETIERLQAASESSPYSESLALARAWLSTLSSLPPPPLPHSTINGNLNGTRTSNASPTHSGASSNNFTAMEDLLKSLPTPTIPPDLISSLVHNNPLVQSLISRSQAILASQGNLFQPATSSATASPITPSTSTPASNIKPSPSNSMDLMTGTAKRKRTRPVYIPPQMRTIVSPLLSYQFSSI